MSETAAQERKLVVGTRHDLRHRGDEPRFLAQWVEPSTRSASACRSVGARIRIQPAKARVRWFFSTPRIAPRCALSMLVTTVRKYAGSDGQASVLAQRSSGHHRPRESSASSGALSPRANRLRRDRPKLSADRASSQRRRSGVHARPGPDALVHAGPLTLHAGLLNGDPCPAVGPQRAPARKT